jgi:uncharacterized cofD-like protein
MPKVVAIGGGTGLSTLLRGLKMVTDRLTAIVTVTDDGGSSGRLREEMGVLPPGDIRNCLVALADDESLLGALFSYRFSAGALSGHSFGNLFLAALTEVTGDFDQAVKVSSRVLNIRGTVLPSTMSDVRLHALLSDGREMAGETSIGRSPVSVERVWLEPSGAEALPLALERIAEADVVVLGPGSLFTSVVPNLIVRGVPEALAAARGPVVYVCNVMTQPGETAGFSAVDHLEALLRHVHEGLIDLMLVNSARVPPNMLARYAEEGAEAVLWTQPEGEHRGVGIVPLPLVEVSDHVRHDPRALAEAVTSLAGARRSPARSLAGPEGP